MLGRACGRTGGQTDTRTDGLRPARPSVRFSAPPIARPFLRSSDRPPVRSPARPPARCDHRCDGDSCGEVHVEDEEGEKTGDAHSTAKKKKEKKEKHVAKPQVGTQDTKHIFDFDRELLLGKRALPPASEKAKLRWEPAVRMQEPENCSPADAIMAVFKDGTTRLFPCITVSMYRTMSSVKSVAAAKENAWEGEHKKSKNRLVVRLKPQKDRNTLAVFYEQGSQKCGVRTDYFGEDHEVATEKSLEIMIVLAKMYEHDEVETDSYIYSGCLKQYVFFSLLHYT